MENHEDRINVCSARVDLDAYTREDLYRIVIHLRDLLERMNSQVTEIQGDIQTLQREKIQLEDYIRNVQERLRESATRYN